jgi:hypothetical protein
MDSPGASSHGAGQSTAPAGGSSSKAQGAGFAPPPPAPAGPPLAPPPPPDPGGGGGAPPGAARGGGAGAGSLGAQKILPGSGPMLVPAVAIEVLSSHTRNPDDVVDDVTKPVAEVVEEVVDAVVAGWLSPLVEKLACGATVAPGNTSLIRTISPRVEEPFSAIA